MYNSASPFAPTTLGFSGSGGITTHLFAGSFLSSFNHVCATKSGSLLSLYINGTLKQTTTDRTLNPVNKHSILFGTENLDWHAPFNGHLDEIRFFNKAMDQATISTLADSTGMGMYQTSIVGNVFYRSGNIIISSLNHKYNKLFQSDFTVKYQGTHRIYSYETLVRIPKGSFNLTMNPTARQSPYSDLIINEMTGSLSDGALFPYATQVGLYNSSRELIAVAKLNQPLQMRDDVNLNIICAFDA